jgi:hypothetical protein
MPISLAIAILLADLLPDGESQQQRENELAIVIITGYPISMTHSL